MDKANHGGVGVGNRSKMSMDERRAEDAALDAFPEMPEGVKAQLETIIRVYGLPLPSLSSATAAFIVKRVLRDYFRITRHGRMLTSLFTIEELQSLMAVMHVDIAALSEIVGAKPDAKGNRNNSIYRWLHGLSRPTGTLAFRVNALIDRHVRRKGTLRQTGSRASTKPETVERRTRKALQLQREGGLAPISQLTGKEPHDGTGPGGRD